MPKNVRNLTKIYHTETTRNTDGTFTMAMHGKTAKGRPLTVKARFEFDLWPYIHNGIKKAWTEERARRWQAIRSIDEVVPGANQP